jgi:ATP-binding cassette subfamily F protein 3
MAFAAPKEITQQDILNIAGSLLFSGDAVHKKVRVLSGGEKSRVALGQILLQKSPLLLLDEPTNHLDFDTVEAMTHSLEKYEGTIITVSHDRGFIGRVANKILEVNNGLLTLYPGTYDEYVWSLKKGILSERNLSEQTETASKSTPQNSESSRFNYKDVRKKIEVQIRKAQKLIEDSDKKVAELGKKRDALNESLISSIGADAGRLAKELHDISEVIDQTEMSMLAAMEEQQNLEAQLKELTGN